MIWENEKEAIREAWHGAGKYEVWTCGASMNHECLGQCRSASLYYRHEALSHLGAEIYTMLRVLSIARLLVIILIVEGDV